ncbi:MAG: glycosyltransferase [Pararhodobacter sp.]|nr:glycosyltransferase [Pararhodobacter sp.]
MQKLGVRVAQSGDDLLRQAYRRNATLIALALKDPRIEEELALPEILGPIAAAGKPGISVVTCAMNRSENLLRALPSWLQQSAVSEVVIVDWSSDEPVREALAAKAVSDPRIKVVRVNGAPRWILSCAFNAGFRAATFDTILKVDADIVLSEDFLSRNGVPAQDSFIAGNWRTVDEGQAHVNGFFFASRAALARVGGFNEFITTYGWDDDDLYARLEAAGFQRNDVAPETIHHLPHSDDERTGEACDASRPACEAIMATTRFKIQRNRVLAEMMPVWSAEMGPLALTIDARQEDGMTLSVAGDPEQAVPEEVFDRASRRMLQELMAWDYGPGVRNLSPDVFDRVMACPASQLSRELFDRAITDPGSIAAPAIAPARRRFFIDAQHGLGNRLRAIGSAAAIAEATGRELVIVWQPDDHCNCRFSDLFAYDGAVLDQSFLHDADACDIHNYMTIEGGEKDAPIRSDGAGDIYARTAFVLNSPHSDWARENRFIQSLSPVEAVQALVNAVRHPNDVSAHVRMEGGRKDEHLPYESTANWTEEDHDLIDHWRAKSHFSHFMKRIDALIEEGRAGRVFIAADRPETYEEFRRAYPDRLAWLERSLYDRSAEQLHYALADAILLSRAPLMLGSTWSSFSELAQRLSPGGMTVEMSGKDF